MLTKYEKRAQNNCSKNVKNAINHSISKVLTNFTSLSKNILFLVLRSYNKLFSS